ncbi:hypothetical protein GDO81_014293 [Engystomops pustulosus]|uniref:Uncharacterized protein n=1 Tax=Engystomops pustulosus TaxID=76066 RepID=A0AAV7B9E8_ENGPU|nr:hypothetical protein GDO81_014293 [Engystomops pustulosus]
MVSTTPSTKNGVPYSLLQIQCALLPPPNMVCSIPSSKYGMRYSLLQIQHAIFLPPKYGVHYSLLQIQCALLPPPNTVCPIPSSKYGVHYSLFQIWHALLPPPNTACSTPSSKYGVHYSLLQIRRALLPPPIRNVLSCHYYSYPSSYSYSHKVPLSWCTEKCVSEHYNSTLKSVVLRGRENGRWGIVQGKVHGKTDDGEQCISVYNL